MVHPRWPSPARWHPALLLKPCAHQLASWWCDMKPHLSHLAAADLGTLAHSETYNGCGLEEMHALGHFGNREGLHRRRGMPHSVGDYIIMAVTLPGTHRACLCGRPPHPHTVRHPLMPTDLLQHKLAGLQHSSAPHSEMLAETRLALACPEAPLALGAHGPVSKPCFPRPHLLQQISSGSAWPGGAAGIGVLAEQPQELQRQESGLPLTAPQMTTQQVHSAETR